MKIQIDDITYTYGWQHDREFTEAPVPDEVPVGKDRGKRHGRTICIISRLEQLGNGVLMHHRVAQGVAEVSAKDQYNKEVGRRISLERAVQKAFPDSLRKQQQMLDHYEHRPRPITTVPQRYRTRENRMS